MTAPLKYGPPTVICSPETASTMSGNTVPTRMIAVAASSSMLLPTNIASREMAESSRAGPRNAGSRHMSSPKPTSMTIARNARYAGPTASA